MSASWVVKANSVCRRYESGVVCKTVPYIQFKLEQDGDSTALSYRFTKKSCLVDKSWHHNAFTWGPSYTYFEAQHEAAKELLKIVNKTFSYLE